MSDDFCSRAVAYIKPAVPSTSQSTNLAKNTPIVKPIGNGLVVTYVVDMGDFMRYVDQAALEAAGLSESDLHHIGVGNLGTSMRGKVAIQDYGPIKAVIAGGFFEASLLLIDSLWDRDLAQFVTTPVVAVPARDILAFCDATSDAGIRELRALVRRINEGGSDHLLIPDLLRRDAGSWAPFES